MDYAVVPYSVPSRRLFQSVPSNNASLVPAVNIARQTKDRPGRWKFENTGCGNRWLPENAMVTNYTNGKGYIPPYNDEQYSNLLFDERWSREETDYLFELCERFGHKLLLVADRYNFPGMEPRRIEDIRERYYGVMGRLGRNESPIRYDKESDRHRRLLITSQQRRDQSKVIEEAILCEMMSQTKLSLPNIIMEREKLLICKTDLGQQLMTHGQTIPEIMGMPTITKNRKNSLTDGVPQSKSNKVSHRKGTSAKKRVTTDPDFEPFSATTTGPGRKPKPTIANTLLRSHILKPIKVGTTRQVDRLLLDMGLQLKPAMPTVSVCEKFNELRILLAQLVEARKHLDSLMGTTTGTTSRSETSKVPSRVTSPMESPPQKTPMETPANSAPVSTRSTKRSRKDI